MKYIFGILLILMTFNCEAQKRENFYTMEIDGIINFGRTNFNRQDVIDRSGPLAFYSRRQYPKRISLGLSTGPAVPLQPLSLVYTSRVETKT